MKIWNKICGIFLIFLLNASLSIGQGLSKVEFSKSQAKFLKTPSDVFQTSEVFFRKKSDALKTSNIYEPDKPLMSGRHLRVTAGKMPDLWKTPDIKYSFFCKKEIQFEKSTGIPFKFRLGSVQQCNRLEGYPNAR